MVVGGTDLSTLDGAGTAALRRRFIGYVFQDLNLLAGLTAAENVSLPLELDGWRTRDPRRPPGRLGGPRGLPARRLRHRPSRAPGRSREPPREPTGGPVTGIRPLVRLAWRDAARNRWRTVLVISMIAIPVAVQVTHSTLVRTVVPTTEEILDNRMGEADVSLSAGAGLQPADVAAALAPGGGRGVAIRTTEARTAELGELLAVSELALDDPLVRGMLRLTSGRAPATADEVAVDPGLLRRYRLRLGGTFSLRRPDLSATVVGTVVNPERLADPVVVAGPGALPTDAPTRYLIALGGTSLASLRQALPAPAPEPAAMVSRQGMAAGSASARPLMILVSFALALVIMSETGLVAAAAFAVGARRQQRELGLLAVSGGTPAHVRAAVLLNAVVLGTAGALSGIAFGLGAALAFRPYLDGLTNRIVGPLDVSPPILAAVALLGVGAASVAAWQPARTAARVSVLASLAARRPASRPAGPLAGIGLGGAVAGTAVLAAGGRNGNAWAAGWTGWPPQ